MYGVYVNSGIYTISHRRENSKKIAKIQHVWCVANLQSSSVPLSHQIGAVDAHYVSFFKMISFSLRFEHVPVPSGLPTPYNISVG